MTEKDNINSIESSIDHTKVMKDDSEVGVSPEPDGEEIGEKRILRKIDLRLLPLVVVLHAISLVDRTNISVARIAGMDEDLMLETDQRVSIVTSTFFIGYILFNIPSNIVIRGVGAARFLGTITVAWGIVTIGIGFVNSWVVAAVLRSLLGVFEAG
jgi:sugar phosphate permease